MGLFRLTILLFALSPSFAVAEQIRLAVASNFTAVAKRLQLEFEAQSNHTLSLSFGSTGKHYAQIRNGAPFDIFLAADAERPERLEREGFALADNRFTYALGQLVLWSSSMRGLGTDTLAQAKFRYVAIANPKLAPYGRAAMQAMENLRVWVQLQGQIVYAENVGQAFAFVYSGNAKLGFVAQSQLLDKDLTGSFWKVPQTYYEPIEQQAILLSNKPAAAEFLLFLKNEKAKSIIANAGFQLP